jgi:hypothetical protein
MAAVLQGHFSYLRIVSLPATGQLAQTEDMSLYATLALALILESIQYPALVELSLEALL